jgi:hypothetical protein
VDPLPLAEYLSARPSRRLTVVFPEKFFGADDRSRRAKELFQRLVSSGQVEVLMTLPHQPVLPLLVDSDWVKDSTGLAAPPRFAWPEDAAGHIALTRLYYRRRWRTDPSGLEVPYGILRGPEADLAARAHLRWLYLPSDEGSPGIVGGAALPRVRAHLWPSGTRVQRRDWLAALVGDSLGAGRWPAPVRVSSLADLAQLEELCGAATPWVPVGDAVAAVVPVEPSGEDASVPDLGRWIGDPEQNWAWDLLGQTRRALEDYKNTGGADVKKWDLALREMYEAESGRFFEALGAEGGRTADRKREFQATLEQIFRLLGLPKPAFLGGTEAGSGGPSRDFFRRDGDVLRWMDAAGDDRGPGDYFYPAGSLYPEGAWDLRGLSVRADGEDVVFGLDWTTLPNPLKAPLGFSFPLVDVYIDINHLPGEGSEALLSERGAVVDAANAWEYVISVSGWGARVQQFVPRGAPKLVGAPTVVRSGSTGVEIRVTRALLRGDLDGWGLAVVVMGALPPGAAGGVARPLPVGVEPGPQQFGGAKSAAAPPIIDVLAPSGPTQSRALSVYKLGHDVMIPVVRAE